MPTEHHISWEKVESVLAGLAENTVIVLPKTCCEAFFLKPNINDKQQPKHLWIGRLKHLNRLISATSLRQAVQPQEVRRSFLQAALDEVESRHPANAEIPIQLAQLPGWKLQQMAHAAIVIQKVWRVRRARQANSMSILKAFQGCITKGFIVFLCGSTGLAGDSLRYVRMLAGMGYLVIAPDDLAGTSDLRRRSPRLILRPDQATDYWERNLLYEDDGAEGELVYVSTSKDVLASPDRFDQIYNNIITVRQAELAFILRKLPDYIKRQGVFLFGMSEGSVTLASFNDESFANMIRGRVLASFSCEMNYWNYNRPEDVGIAGSADVPTLNFMGYEDEYFGVNNSVAATVAAYGDYPPIAGHAFQQMVDRGMQWGLVCHFEGGYHSLLLTHDDIIREILSDFLVRPLTTCRSLAVLWGNLPELQDEVTRVRRSSDEKVLYVRIRPPHGTASRPSSRQICRQREALLDALSARLYQLEHSNSRSFDPSHSSWEEIHKTLLGSPMAEASQDNLFGGRCATDNAIPVEKSLEDASSPVAAGSEKSKARAATARLVAHLSFRDSKGRVDLGAQHSAAQPVLSTTGEGASPAISSSSTENGLQHPQIPASPTVLGEESQEAVKMTEAQRLTADALDGMQHAATFRAGQGTSIGQLSPGTAAEVLARAEPQVGFCPQAETQMHQEPRAGSTGGHIASKPIDAHGQPRVAISRLSLDLRNDSSLASSVHNEKADDWHQRRAAPLTFSPAQRLLASSLASERDSPCSSPSRSDLDTSLLQHKTSGSAGGAAFSQGAAFRRSHSNRCLSAAAAASAATLYQVPHEDFESGLETLQDMMQKEGQARSPSRGLAASMNWKQQQQALFPPAAATPSDIDVSSERLRLRSVHFSQNVTSSGTDDEAAHHGLTAPQAGSVEGSLRRRHQKMDSSDPLLTHLQAISKATQVAAWSCAASSLASILVAVMLFMKH